MAIIPLGNTIVFKFLDRVNNKGEFERDATASGIQLLAGFDDSAKTPRWVRVLAVGPKVENINAGDQILLPALRWTAGVTYGESKFWKTDEKQVVAKRTSEDGELSVLNSNLLFFPVARETMKSSFGIIIPVADKSTTASGITYLSGPDASPELSPGVEFYFDDSLFTEKFVHQAREYSFIKDELVLAYKAE